MVLGVLRQRVWNCLTAIPVNAFNFGIERCAFLHCGSANGTDRIEKNCRAAPWSVLFFGTDEFALQSLKQLNDQYASPIVVSFTLQSDTGKEKERNIYICKTSHWKDVPIMKDKFLNNNMSSQTVKKRKMLHCCSRVGTVTTFAFSRLNKLLCRLEVVTAYKGKENAVIQYANQHGIKIHPWPPTISPKEYDVGLVVSFGHMIPVEMIESFPLGMINVHASLLPKWRGAAPIIRCLMNGDSQTGVTIMRIKPDKFDVGEILAQEETDILPDETMPELYIKLANIGAHLLIRTVEKLPGVLSDGRKQSDAEATYARKVNAKFSMIKWKDMSAKNVYDLQRAFTGLYPLTTKFRDNTIKIFGIKVCEEPPRLPNLPKDKPGCVIYDKKRKLLLVQCKGESWITVDQIVVPGRKPMSAQDFRNGFIANQKEAWILFQ